ncbi:sushi, von Willebrand factor type A, EGF and pentraxin domain-containing protein 1-like [Dreissena polymorpha]|uniref:sushi, von Willebrand factor type A, EGF and pentraxin domain-containing protein 1-like n=1 Tax=Dreissena polymorpha TaxID=45954 RepID=UPI002265314E|nr:sushi, von Willebrand factor type A, EGF and pentraxin domain-containing protein 1-like [Dreissena polymorpha]
MTAVWYTDGSVVNKGFYALYKAVLNNSECIPVDCGPPPQISRGHLGTYFSTLNPSTIEIKCDPGYLHSNKIFTQCQSNGRWSVAECTLVCKQWAGLTDLPVNQMITYPNHTTFIGDTALMTCDAGYHVFNDSSNHTEMAVCTSNGTWSPYTYSHCVPIDCGLPPALDNGMMKLMNNTTHFQSQADVTCKHGYFLNGSSSTIDCTDDGHWSLDDSHRCLPVDCGLPPSLANGNVKLLNNLTTFPSQAEVTCNRGYFLNSSFNILNCTEKGSWNQDSYSCLLVDCREWYSSLPKHQTIIYKNATSFGSKAIMTCNQGYHVVNKTNIVSESAICTENGTWSLPSYTVCVPTVEKTFRNCTKDITWNETQAGTIVEEKCPNGYSGKVSRQCSEEGLWLNPFYNCVSERVAELMSAVESIKETPSAENITNILDQLINVTKPDKGSSYIGDLNAITSILDTIASVSNKIEVTDEQAETFFNTTSNLLDTANAESWQSGENDGSTDGSVRSVDNMIKSLL